MNISRVDKKKEAIKRMEVLDIFGETIRQFEEEGLISYSEPPLCANYWLTTEQREIVKKFEEEYNALVYFATTSYTDLGRLDAFLYVSDYEDEWKEDIEYLKDGYAYAYVYNCDFPEFSEPGLVRVQPRFGGLVRIG
jgi:hypothetical protein